MQPDNITVGPITYIYLCLGQDFEQNHKKFNDDMYVLHARAHGSTNPS